MKFFSNISCLNYLASRFEPNYTFSKDHIHRALNLKFRSLTNEEKLYLIESLELSQNKRKNISLITKKRLTLEQLLLAKVHLGHNYSLWNQWCSSFLFGERYNQHIFDLSKSLFHMKKILKVLALVSNNKGKILFISTKTDKSRLIESLIPNNHMFLCSSWVGGLLTNWHSLTEPFHSNTLEKERSIKSLFRKKVRLLKIFRGFLITGRITSKLPDLIVFLNVNENRFAIKEAQQLNIPTIGIVDSDSDPRGLTYVIPGNDDSIESHLFYLQFFKKALTK